LIEVSNGDSKPITPEGIVGVQPSPDGRSTTVLGTDGKVGIWPLDGSGLRPIPGLDPSYRVIGWSADGKSVYVVSRRERKKIGNIFRVDVVTGKTDLSRNFGDGVPPGAVSAAASFLSGDGGAHAYIYEQRLSQVYVVKGLK
jgi:hypothetical protein